MIAPGKYQANVADYTADVSPNGKPYVKVWLNVENQGQVTWTGYLTEKTQERTIQSLTYMGFKGDDIGVLADGVLSQALDLTTPVNITVIHETDKNNPAKKYAKVQWVNRAGQTARVIDPVKNAQAKSQLSQFNGTLKKVQSELGVKATTTKVAF